MAAKKTAKRKSTATRRPRAEKLTRGMRETLVAIALDKKSQWGWETDAMLASAGLITIERDGEKKLTAAGRDVAKELVAKFEAARKKTNAKSRAKNAAMSSFGLKRTRSGSWE